jgi:RNA polymerase sigma factor (sigma-70 family)
VTAGGMDDGAERVSADAELIRDCDASRLFVEHYTALLRFLRRYTGDADLAEDAAQEAFARLIEKPPALATRAWLFTVGKHAALDAMRTRVKRLRLASAAPDRTPMGDPPLSPYEVAEATSIRKIVREALESLSERERKILLMREEGFRYFEIAAATGITLPSMGKTLARSLEKLEVQIRRRSR